MWIWCNSQVQGRLFTSYRLFLISFNKLSSSFQFVSQAIVDFSFHFISYRSLIVLSHFKKELFSNGIYDMFSIRFVYVKHITWRMVLLFIKEYFQIKWQTICNMYSIIPEAWNIQACKHLPGIVTYTGDADE